MTARTDHENRMRRITVGVDNVLVMAQKRSEILQPDEEDESFVIPTLQTITERESSMIQYIQCMLKNSHHQAQIVLVGDAALAEIRGYRLPSQKTTDLDLLVIGVTQDEVEKVLHDHQAEGKYTISYDYARTYPGKRKIYYRLTFKDGVQVHVFCTIFPDTKEQLLDIGDALRHLPNGTVGIICEGHEYRGYSPFQNGIDHVRDNTIVGHPFPEGVESGSIATFTAVLRWIIDTQRLPYFSIPNEDYNKMRRWSAAFQEQNLTDEETQTLDVVLHSELSKAFDRFGKSDNRESASIFFWKLQYTGFLQALLGPAWSITSRRLSSQDPHRLALMNFFGQESSWEIFQTAFTLCSDIPTAEIAERTGLPLPEHWHTSIYWNKKVLENISEKPLVFEGIYIPASQVIHHQTADKKYHAVSYQDFITRKILYEKAHDIYWKQIQPRIERFILRERRDIYKETGLDIFGGKEGIFEEMVRTAIIRLLMSDVFEQAFYQSLTLAQYTDLLSADTSFTSKLDRQLAELLNVWHNIPVEKRHKTT
ncbi:MAG: hypothetical protein HZA34_01130 [Candidatus Pacebacteria bacterium]|nr:hypothetical protein [Candidatus Paceibacterota bacterium]